VWARIHSHSLTPLTHSLTHIHPPHGEVVIRQQWAALSARHQLIIVRQHKSASFCGQWLTLASRKLRRLKQQFHHQPRSSRNAWAVAWTTHTGAYSWTRCIRLRPSVRSSSSASSLHYHVAWTTHKSAYSWTSLNLYHHSFMSFIFARESCRIVQHV